MVGLPPGPHPSARDEFHQAYAKELQDTDKSVEGLSRALDSASYLVSDAIPLSPQHSALGSNTNP